jgi:NAD-dependent SIR2 family protein deacetylase
LREWGRREIENKNGSERYYRELTLILEEQSGRVSLIRAQGKMTYLECHKCFFR